MVEWEPKKLDYLTVYNATPQGLFSAVQKFTSPSGAAISGAGHFGLSYKYQGTVAVGNRAFSLDLNQANFHFNATSVSSLSINNDIGTLTGMGTINGQGTYNFLVVGRDSMSTAGVPVNAIERAVPAGKVIHAILDNYATHKHPKVRAWLANHPRWVFHFTPTSASWLNAVEGFFSVLTRRRLERGIFKSVADLEAAIARYIREHNSTAKPFVWTTTAKPSSPNSTACLY
jgi:transposase